MIFPLPETVTHEIFLNLPSPRQLTLLAEQGEVNNLFYSPFVISFSSTPKTSNFPDGTWTRISSSRKKKEEKNKSRARESQLLSTYFRSVCSIAAFLLPANFLRLPCVIWHFVGCLAELTVCLWLLAVDVSMLHRPLVIIQSYSLYEWRERRRNDMNQFTWASKKRQGKFLNWLTAGCCGMAEGESRQNQPESIGQEGQLTQFIAQ